MDICIPKKKFPLKNTFPPILLSAIKRRNSLIRANKRTGSVNNIEEYKKQRNLIPTAIPHT